MYLIFPPEYEGLAKAVSLQVSTQYQYNSKSSDTSGYIPADVGPEDLVVATWDMEEARQNLDVAEYRWGILRAMSQGAVFVNFDKPNTTHFFDPQEGTTTEQQIDAIILAGRYAEGRAKYINSIAPKADYVGPTYVAPLMSVVVTYDSKKDDFTVDYDERVRNFLASLPEDLWMKSAFVTSRMGSTLQKLLDEFYETAIITLDKKGSTKVGSLNHEQVKAPTKIDLLFGRTLNNIAKTKEVDAV